MKAHWCHLANTIEFMILSAHPSPQIIRQQFSHFAQLTAESPYTSQWVPLSPDIALHMGDLDPI